MGKKKSGKKKSGKKKSTYSPKSNYTRNSIIFLLVFAFLVFIWWGINNIKY